MAGSNRKLQSTKALICVLLLGVFAFSERSSATDQTPGYDSDFSIHSSAETGSLIRKIFGSRVSLKPLLISQIMTSSRSADMTDLYFDDLDLCALVNPNLSMTSLRSRRQVSLIPLYHPKTSYYMILNYLDKKFYARGQQEIKLRNPKFVAHRKLLNKDIYLVEVKLPFSNGRYTIMDGLTCK